MTQHKGIKGRRRLEQSEKQMLVMQEILKKSMPEILDISKTDRNTILPKNHFNVVFDENGKQITLTDAKKQLREWLQWALRREPTKAEIEIGFATWRSFWRVNSGNMDGREIRLRGGRRVLLKSSKPKSTTRHSSAEMEQAVLSAVIKKGCKVEEIRRRKWNQKEWNCQDCGTKIALTMSIKYNGCCDHCYHQRILKQNADAGYNEEVEIEWKIGTGFNGILFGEA